MQRIRIAVVGCGGGRGAWFVGQLCRHPAYQITALVDLWPQAAQVVAQHFGVENTPIYKDVTTALERAPCDAVLIATPDAMHTEPVLAALAHGKYVFVEKPLATTLDDCCAIIAADLAAGGRTMVGFNLRYTPLYVQLHQMITQGVVGRLLTIQADEFYYEGRTFFRRWNRLRRYGGGLWITKACHDFDILYWLAGAEPDRISASARLTHYTSRPEAGLYCHACDVEPTCPDSYLRDPQYQRPLRQKLDAARISADLPPADLCLYNSEKETFDHGIAQIVFSNEVLAVYTLNIVAAFSDRNICISGTEGIVQGSLSRNELLYWRRHQDKDPGKAERIPLQIGDPSSGHGGGDAFLLDDFAAFVRGEPTRRITPTEASVAVAMGLAATQASDTEKSVALATIDGWSEMQAAIGL